MQKSESTKEITKAIIAVMKEVKGIDKNLTVGSGNSAYKGVSDQDVKKEVGKAMERNGLALVPIDVEPDYKIERWTENTQYGEKVKQQVFTSVKTKYLLLHDSGEWIELSGFGHGIDTQDKAAGKASTYALKYTMLYTFMVPTGKIDDSDNNHSDDYDRPKATPKQPVKQKLSGKAFEDACARIDKGEVELIQKLKETYALDELQLTTLEGKEKLLSVNAN